MPRRVQGLLYDGNGDLIGFGWVTTGTGATSARPTGLPAGSMWYDTTLHKPIWYDGSAWRDASGTIV